jgi:hypothetical protein
MLACVYILDASEAPMHICTTLLRMIMMMQEAVRVFVCVQEQAEKYQQYAVLCMEEVASQGKSVKPIELHLTKRSSNITLR